MSALLYKNKKALYDHQVLENYTAGIVLKGYEVKAVKEKKVSMDGSYVQIIDGVPMVVNMYIGEYSKQSRDVSDYETRRSRKLLIHKNEIEEISKEVSQKGKTAVPIALVLEHGKIKLEFAVVKGKKEYEKKQVAKDRQILKDLQAETKEVKRLLDF